MEIKFIIIITVALFFIALVQLMKVYDLAAKVRGEKSQEKVSRRKHVDGKFNANLYDSIFGFVIWLIAKYGLMQDFILQLQNMGKRLISY